MVRVHEGYFAERPSAPTKRWRSFEFAAPDALPATRSKSGAVWNEGRAQVSHRRR